MYFRSAISPQGSLASMKKQIVRPFFQVFPEKWLLGIKRVKVVTDGRPGMHLQKVPTLSRQWGPIQYPREK